MDPIRSFSQFVTRRHFFRDCGVGVGKIALASLLTGKARGADAARPAANLLAPKPPHFPAKAKAVIHLFMAGAPSQLDLFDNKPTLRKFDGQPVGKVNFVLRDSKDRIWMTVSTRIKNWMHALRVD